MRCDDRANPPVRAGDLDGLRRIYSETSGLITKSDEEILKAVTGWDVNVQSPWRKFLPKFVFMGFEGRTSSKLFVTNKRIVLVRDIDPWRELKGELTPLGIPTAAAKEAKLKKLKSLGARQYCEIRPADLRIVKEKRCDRPQAGVNLHHVAVNGTLQGSTLGRTD